MKTKTIIFCLATLFSLPVFAQRDTINLNNDWQFCIDKNATGIQEKWFEKLLTVTESVHLPHTWSIEEANQNHYGWGWYQKKLMIPIEWKNKNIILQFGAINHTSMIFINGKKIEENIGDGFNKIQINLNGKINYGKENIITVACNNDYGKNKVPFANSFDWPNDGGIIRPAVLIVSGKPGASWIHATPALKADDSTGKIKIQVGFDELKNFQTNFKVTITEENQPTKNIIYQSIVRVTWENNEAICEIQLPKIHPWHFDFPNLYRVDVEIIQDKKITDKISCNTGFRNIVFKNSKIYLNGERVKLIGVEWTAGSNPDFGFAETDSVIIAMGKLMKNVNCIFSRQHFQQGDLFYDFCDRNGILVQQELPLWGGETPANDTIQSIALAQLKKMIHFNYNHPSIFSWGVGNELRARDSDMKKMIAVLLAASHKLDPSRNTAYVSNTLTEGFYNNPNFVPDASADGDYLMMNEYGGSWWDLPVAEIGNYLDSIHLSYPDKTFIISEFGLCEPNFKGGDERRTEDLIYHMGIYESKSYVEGAIYFDLTDYRTHYPGTREVNKYRRRIHGVYDMYGNPKPSMTVLRELSSPVEVKQINSWKKGKLSIAIFGSMGLPQYIVRNYKLYISAIGDDFKNTKAYDLPEIHPGEKINFEVDDLYDGKGIITIVRPSGYVVSQKSFY